MAAYPSLDSAALEQLLSERIDTPLSLGDLPDPYAFKDMERSVERLVEAIEHRHTIVLVGDYDVDGVIATAIVKRFFDAIDVPLQTIIPNRFEDGYGLSPGIVDRIESADLILTVDNGIGAHEAAEICARRGIDLIITDHHLPAETLPRAYALIDPKQPECTFPYDEVCGAQIAWYLCAALNRRLEAKVDLKSYLDMVAIAVIADMMPLQHINRTMVIAGLQQFARSRWPFIRAYREANPQRQARAEEIGFGLAPMINSAGRLEDAGIALAYVLSDTLEAAREGYAKLHALNHKRKTIEEEVTEAAIALSDTEAPVIVAVGDGWHEGVVGIVAARLVRRFERPAIVLSRTGDVCKGSGRSWRACHLYELLRRQHEQMHAFGGHRAAIGMSIAAENLAAFVRQLQHDAGELCLQTQERDPDILGELPFGIVTDALMRLIDRFEPYGQGNPRPKFITRDVTLVALQTMGKERNHLRFTFASDGHYLQGVQFKTTDTHPVGARYDIIYTLNENHFRGETTIQLMIEKITRK
jgi:single-stranded-DNA-specific exonuclease